MSRFDESTCSRASVACRLGAARRDRLADRAVLEVVLRVELVELGPRAPRPVADERPSRALRDALDERQLRDAVDDVVEGVVRLHPLDEERRVARRAAARLRRGARASARRSAARSRSISARSSGVIFGVATSVASASSSARTRNASWSSCAEIERTRTPRFGSNETSPSAASRRSASRTGVRRHLEPLGERLLAEHGPGRDRAADDLVLEDPARCRRPSWRPCSRGRV